MADTVPRGMEYGLMPQYATPPTMQGDLAPMWGGPGLDQWMISTAGVPEFSFDYNQLANQILMGMPQPAPQPVYYMVDPTAGMGLPGPGTWDPASPGGVAPGSMGLSDPYNYDSLPSATQSALVQAGLEWANRGTADDWWNQGGLEWIAPDVYAQSSRPGLPWQQDLNDLLGLNNLPTTTTTQNVGVPEQFKPYFATAQDFWNWMQGSVSPYANPGSIQSVRQTAEGSGKPANDPRQGNRQLFDPYRSAYNQSSRFSQGRRPQVNSMTQPTPPQPNTNAPGRPGIKR